MKRILSVRVYRTVDDTPDLSHLGEYRSDPGPDERTVDRQTRGDWRPGQYRYFVAAHSAEETGSPDSVGEDYRRMEAHNEGDWHMCGVYARATVLLSANGPIQTFQSGGLWNIESDSGEDCFAALESEQLAELAAELAAAGFDKVAVDEAFAEAHSAA